ncbi:hypothetical protein [Jannaschia sp. 2305UL9-9]
MRNSFKMVAVLGVTLVLSACGSSEEEVVFVPTVAPEPVSTKY